MNLFDDIIENIQSLTKDSKPLSIHPSKVENAQSQNMVFQSDMAYEMNGYSITIPTTEIDIEDSIECIGPDLDKLNSNSIFCRIVLLKIKETDKTAEALYNMIKRLEFTKYHVFPKGFMMRISSMMDKERVRVSKKELHKLSIEEVSNHFIDAYKKHKEVIGVKIIYITDPNFNLDLITPLIQKVKDRTNLIEHMTKDLNMNCDTCHEKVICDAVDGMKELHKQSR